MVRRATVTKETIDRAATLVRHAHPNGIDRGALCEGIGVNVSTWRTGGYEQALVARHPDVYVDRGKLYNDGEKTDVFLSLKAAVANGEREWAAELRARWDALHTAPRGQMTLDVGEES